MSRTKHVTVGNTARRNGETRTHGPLVPNQVRYLLRHIPLGDAVRMTKTISFQRCHPYGATTDVIPVTATSASAQPTRQATMA